MYNQFTSVLIAAGLLLAGCASTTESSVPVVKAYGDLVLRASSNGKWSVSCSAETTRGNTAKDDIKGRAGFDFGVIALRDAVGASCDYAADDAPLTLTLSDEGLSCPFGAYEDGKCETIIAAGANGRFDVSPVGN